MGATSEDTQHEIGALRADMTAALGEIEQRIRGGVRGVAVADARVSGARTGQAATQQARALAQDYPAGIGAAGVLAVAAIGYGVYVGLSRWQARRTPQERIKRRANETREEFQRRVEAVRRRATDARKTVDETRRRGVLLKVEREGDQYLRVVDARLDPPNSAKGSRNNVVKNLLWAALLSVFMAGAGVAARRVAGLLWRATVREEPPTEKK